MRTRRPKQAGASASARHDSRHFEPGTAQPRPPAGDLSQLNMATYIPYEDVAGKQATINQLNGLLSQLDINTVVPVIAAINNLYRANLDEPPERNYPTQANLARHLLSDELWQKLHGGRFGTDRRTLLFHRQQQLFLLRHALMMCRHDGGVAWEPQGKHLLGEACLLANGLLNASKSPTGAEAGTDDELLRRMHTFLSAAEIANEHEPVDAIGRAVQLWIKVPDEQELKKSSIYMPLASLFRDAYGIELELFLRILFLLYIKVYLAKPTHPEPWTQFIITYQNTFRNAGYSEALVRQAMGVLSYKLLDMGNLLHTQPPHSMTSDFANLYRYPIIEVQSGTYVIYDKQVLLQFFTSGIWWLLHDALPHDRRETFRSFFGDVFARYAERVLRHACEGAPSRIQQRLFPRLKFGPTDEVCDALLVAEDSWVMMEVKASLLTQQAKYADEAVYLQNQINDKFAKTGKGSKGVGQLAKSIKRLAGGASILNTSLDFSQPKKLYPVIVSYDATVSGKFVAQYLDRKLRAELGDLPTGSPKVMPLTVLNMMDLEAFTALARRHALPDLLASYRLGATPFCSFKDHILPKFRYDVKWETAFPLQNFDVMHEAVLADFQAAL